MNHSVMLGMLVLALLTGCHRPQTHPVSVISIDSPQAVAAFGNACGRILQGDLEAALTLLETIPPKALPERERNNRQAILDRFRQKASPLPNIQSPFARDVASIYTQYWTRGLLKSIGQEAGEAKLKNQLQACLDKHHKNGSQYQSLNDLTEALGPMLLDEGFHSLRGRTAPFYELMLWRKEETKTYEVPLPESTQTVKVVFMSDFVLQGWLGFATCGYYHSGGWAKKEALYCLAESYDLQSENFRVSYLSHEAQHVSDYLRFPRMKQAELEYRAKLVEVSQAEETLLSLLNQFAKQSGEDRNSPHSFANRQVTLNLSKTLFRDDSAFLNPSRWSEKTRGDTQAGALTCLRENSRLLESHGPDRVEQVL